MQLFCRGVKMTKLPSLLETIKSCKICAAELPLGPNPVLHVGRGSAQILIIGQAPGTKVHKTGIPWNDPSGDRLRQWLGLSREEFYNSRKIAIMPMGFCYPGKGDGGDLPPRPACAKRWHAQILRALPNIKLTLLIGQYAQAYYLGDRRKATLAETVKAWREYSREGYWPLVHPSPRNRLWLRKNPWFEEETVKFLRKKVAEILGSTSAPHL